MDIRFDFSALWSQVRRVSDKRVEFDWDAVVPLGEDIDIALSLGKEVELDDLEIVNGMPSLDGRQVLLYIPDHHRPLDDVMRNPELGNRFHVADCQKLAEMRRTGHFEKYVATNDLSGLFRIRAKYDRERPDCRLLVCKLCLRKLNYRGYNSASTHAARAAVWTDFSIGEFFETYATNFRHRPNRWADDGKVNDYAENWKDISAELRRRCGFMCDQCKIDLSSCARLLHVHHENGIKFDNSAANLRPLCIDCHRRQPNHGHIFVTAADMGVIVRLRREQGLRATDWKSVLDLADLALHGVLLQARQLNYSIPELAFDIHNAYSGASTTVDVAWPLRRIAICTGKKPPISGWQLLSPVEFLDKIRTQARQAGGWA